MKIPFTDLKPYSQLIEEDLVAATRKVLNSGRYYEGRYTQELEHYFKEKYPFSFATTTSNCTSAIYLTLRANGIGEGSEVLLPALSYVATLNAVLLTGATPVFYDGAGPAKIDLTNLENQMTSRTAAIIFVQLFGQATDPRPFLNLASSFNIPLIEDRAQWLPQEEPFGSEAQNHFICYSFDPTKNLGSIDGGGIVLSNHSSVIQIIKQMKTQGFKNGVFHTGSTVARLSEIGAASILVGLKHFKELEDKRRDFALFLKSLLDQLPRELCQVYCGDIEDLATWHKFVLLASKRNELARFLEENDIITKVHYPYTLNELIDYKSDSQNFPNTKNFQENGLSLPIGPFLSKDDAMYIFEKVKSFLT